VCQNTGGGYTCKCKSGYQQKNAYECEGKKMTIESSNMGSNEKSLKNRDMGNNSFVDRYLSICPFSFGLCVVCP
jgi:hypothetical protein